MNNLLSLTGQISNNNKAIPTNRCHNYKNHNINAIY